MNHQFKHLMSRALLAAACLIETSCTPWTQAPPVTSQLVYRLPKTMAPCGGNVSCIDFAGTATFVAPADSCTNQTPQVFNFDASSYMVLNIYTQPIFSPQQLNVQLSQTDPNGQNVQPPWNIVLIPPAGAPQDSWQFTFRVTKQAPTDLPLIQGAAIAGHYVLTTEGNFDTTAPTLLIQAEMVAQGTLTKLCTQN
jgi:hypothetical protein